MIIVPSRLCIQSEACMLPSPSRRLSVQKFPTAQQGNLPNTCPVQIKLQTQTHTNIHHFCQFAPIGHAQWDICASEQSAVPRTFPGQIVWHSALFWKSCALQVETGKFPADVSMISCKHCKPLHQFFWLQPQLFCFTAFWQIPIRNEWRQIHTIYTQASSLL